MTHVHAIIVLLHLLVTKNYFAIHENNSDNFQL